MLSHFSRVRLCATLWTAAHQAPPSLGFSRQEPWSGLPFPSPMHESEKWKWSRSVVSDPQRRHGLQPTRLLHPWDFPGKSTGVGWPMFIAALFTIATIWKLVFAEKWMDKEDMAYINMAYYISYFQQDAWIRRILHLVKQVRERQVVDVITCPWNLKIKWVYITYRSESISHTETDSIENKIVVINGETKRGGPKQV